MTLKTLITVVLGAGALLVGAQSALAVPPDMSGNPNSSQGEPQQIVVRGQGPTTLYGLGTGGTPQYEKALNARSQGLNQIYGLGNGVTPQYEKALTVRGQGLNSQYGLGNQSNPVVVHDHGDATQAKLDSQSIAKEREALARYYKGVFSDAQPVVIHDHGDATQAKLDSQSTAVSSRPELDSGWSFDWPQVGIGIGVAMLVAFGLFLTVRHTRHPVAH